MKTIRYHLKHCLADVIKWAERVAQKVNKTFTLRHRQPITERDTQFSFKITMVAMALQIVVVGFNVYVTNCAEQSQIATFSREREAIN